MLLNRLKMNNQPRNLIAGFEGSIGPLKFQYLDPHVYARDIHSGAGNCVCGGSPSYKLHVQSPLAPDAPMSVKEAMDYFADREIEISKLKIKAIFCIGPKEMFMKRQELGNEHGQT